jgi:hypothetical protein
VTSPRANGRRENHTAICAIAIVAGLAFVFLGFVVVGGAIGFTLGGAGFGLAVVGIRGALTGESPRWF